MFIYACMMARNMTFDVLDHVIKGESLIFAPRAFSSRLAPFLSPRACFRALFHGHGFIGYPKGRNVETALGPSCPCILCIPIHIITINIDSFLGCHISHSLGLYLLQQI